MKVPTLNNKNGLIYYEENINGNLYFSVGNPSNNRPTSNT